MSHARRAIDLRPGRLLETARVVFSRPFPRPLLDRRYRVATTVAHWPGMGDKGYAIDYAKSFSEMWGASDGRWALTASDDAA